MATDPQPLLSPLEEFIANNTDISTSSLLSFLGRRDLGQAALASTIVCKAVMFTPCYETLWHDRYDYPVTFPPTAKKVHINTHSQALLAIEARKQSLAPRIQPSDMVDISHIYIPKNIHKLKGQIGWLGMHEWKEFALLRDLSLAFGMAVPGIPLPDDLERLWLSAPIVMHNSYNVLADLMPSRVNQLTLEFPRMSVRYIPSEVRKLMLKFTQWVADEPIVILPQTIKSIHLLPIDESGPWYPPVFKLPDNIESLSIHMGFMREGLGFISSLPRTITRIHLNLVVVDDSINELECLEELSLSACNIENVQIIGKHAKRIRMEFATFDDKNVFMGAQNLEFLTLFRCESSGWIHLPKHVIGVSMIDCTYMRFTSLDHVPITRVVGIPEASLGAPYVAKWTYMDVWKADTAHDPPILRIESALCSPPPPGPGLATIDALCAPHTDISLIRHQMHPNFGILFIEIADTRHLEWLPPTVHTLVIIKLGGWFEPSSLPPRLKKLGLPKERLEQFKKCSFPEGLIVEDAQYMLNDHKRWADNLFRMSITEERDPFEK